MTSTISQRPANGPLKVAICITGLEVGGAETVLGELLRGKPDDIEIKVFSLIDGGAVAERIVGYGIPIVGLHMEAGRPSLGAFFRLVRELRSFRPALVHTWLYHADLMGGLAAKLSGARHVVWHLHNCDLSPWRTRRMTRVVVRSLALLSHVIPDVILSCSEEAARVHVALGYAKRKVRILPNGVDAARFAPSDEARASVRDELGLPADAKIVGLVARVDPQKNHRGFFDAVEEFFDHDGEAYFVLAGRDVTPEHWQLGAWRARSRRPEHILLLGPRSDVPRLMAAFDVATSSSLGEAFPLVIAEAMSCGVPCVATDVGDCRLMIGDTGRIVPPGDAAALARGWQELLGMPASERRELGERARRRVLDNYTIERFSERVWTLYRELTDADNVS